jgi:hypothetical protein
VPDPPRCPRMTGERGLVAGAEALAVGSLVLVAGMLLLVNAWAVIDTRIALDSAAREYLRTYTEADSQAEARTLAEMAALDVLDGRDATIEDRTRHFGACAPAAVQLTARVPAVTIPFISAQWGVRTVAVEAAELIDAHREMTPSAGYDPTGTRCHD